MPVEVVSVDGSLGEGGGQILRTSAALSAITGNPIAIHGIRARRPKPGLAAQHLGGLELLREMCGGKLEGAKIGSTDLKFSPGRVVPGDYALDIGTAGSITLALQTILPAIAHAGGTYGITLTGGTDVSWSPPLDYYRLVLFPVLSRCGLECRLTAESRGYYPRGGGRVMASFSAAGSLNPIELRDFSSVNAITGIVNITGLPIHIARRVRDSAFQCLPEGLRELAEVQIESSESGASQGVGIVLAATDGRAVLGASSLGQRGKPAEAVGREAAMSLLKELEGGGSVDAYASDQLLPYLALAGGNYSAGSLTEHASTNIRVIRGLLGVSIETTEGEVTGFEANEPYAGKS